MFWIWQQVLDRIFPGSERLVVVSLHDMKVGELYQFSILGESGRPGYFLVLDRTEIESTYRSKTCLFIKIYNLHLEKMQEMAWACAPNDPEEDNSFVLVSGL